jgi:hypothetical protein
MQRNRKLILAGIGVALAAVAVGLSMRSAGAQEGSGPAAPGQTKTVESRVSVHKDGEGPIPPPPLVTDDSVDAPDLSPGPPSEDAVPFDEVLEPQELPDGDPADNS